MAATIVAGRSAPRSLELGAWPRLMEHRRTRDNFNWSKQMSVFCGSVRSLEAIELLNSDDL
jgi:hypothetical protein